MAVMRARLAPLLLSLALLGACQLIDQRTFERTGASPTAADIARSGALAAASAARPLVSVFPGQLERDWRPDVLAAVRDALVRNPGAAFDIVTPVPTAGGADAQQAALDTGSADAAAVAAVIEADGVASEKLHLGARGDAGRPAREVMVFLRAS